MFSENKKISPRQTRRMLAFDITGISTLLLPPLLAGVAGSDGLFCIFLALIPAYLYMGIMKMVQKDAGGDYLTYIKKSSGNLFGGLLLGLYYICFVLLTGYILYTLTTLIESALLKEESYWLINIMILVLAGYGILEGIEGRARIYEILFWILLIPLLMMLVLAARDVNPNYWTPVIFTSWQKVLRGTLLVFLFYMLQFFSLFLLPYEKTEGQTIRSASKVINKTALINATIYLILLGIFGQKALPNMQYPIITLMSMIKLPGGFFERQDAFMVAIWFFSLYALINSGMFHGTEALKKLVPKKGNKRYMLITLLLVFATSAVYYKSAPGMFMFREYVAVVGLPIIICVPLLVYLIGRVRHQSGGKNA